MSSLYQQVYIMSPMSSYINQQPKVHSIYIVQLLVTTPNGVKPMQSQNFLSHRKFFGRRGSVVPWYLVPKCIPYGISYCHIRPLCQLVSYIVSCHLCCGNLSIFCKLSSPFVNVSHLQVRCYVRSCTCSFVCPLTTGLQGHTLRCAFRTE